MLVTPSNVTVEVTVNGLPQPCVLHLSCLEDSLSSLRPIVTSSEGERAVICDFPEGGYSRGVSQWRIHKENIMAHDVALVIKQDQYHISITNFVSVKSTLQSDGRVTIRSDVEVTDLSVSHEVQLVERRIRLLLEMMSICEFRGEKILVLTSPSLGSYVWSRWQVRASYIVNLHRE
eukprot:Blabericola_migrator_1__1357@NODE_1351_length_4742_cov_13_507166_g669_i2_p2_GENE_NODE_1351_length_4742_cov_13_507166_g669_i2NODE_1351_length_4742_cov_13_507166_g669_i2_p2_ORF_typecomplete_len176_score16_27DUF961/PF06125_11/0_048_NODE_1351_length_4742_cov_13_507166_g669_i228903417